MAPPQEASVIGGDGNGAFDSNRCSEGIGSMPLVLPLGGSASVRVPGRQAVEVGA